MTLINLPNQAILPLGEPPINPYRLGASLYMSATRADLWQVITRQQLPEVTSLVICLADAVSERDIDDALTNVQRLLTDWQTQVKAHLDNDVSQPTAFDRPLVFIRPRHATMLAQMATWQGIALIDGFILPKIDMLSLADWRLAWQQHADGNDTPPLVMPTLETAPIFNPHHNHELAQAFIEAFAERVLALRIGGNNLLACLRLRRPRQTTIYATPIGTLIDQLVGCFVPYGFYLTAPVFEYLDTPELFAQELQHDVALGLVGKTVIHPSQIAAVQRAFAVEASTVADANAILTQDTKAVFRQDNAMLEPTTHAAWARTVLLRAAVYDTID
ncbi:HpcH/HpaI aldolase/citrate lyase family protein [Faucicola atlantae]|uniref:Citrate lyase subunit beta-like protein n=1 Tax=Faucicola atlantae TaxID=34059 RepID=A0A1B8QEJ7_9GAMM|nr:HpcH/HpaI aldolase/citrate lyase family protein [Moraxella atlantae]OBX80133.1 citrate lyase subunit beta-like protein [Moraxella atlantae]